MRPLTRTETRDPVPELRPFKALKYTTDAGDPSDLIAPPYDVIDARMSEELRSSGYRPVTVNLIPTVPVLIGHGGPHQGRKISSNTAV